MIQLYFNGDSFVAGVELGDDILPEYPGLHGYDVQNSTKLKYKEWCDNSHNPKHYSNQYRVENFKKITELEYERAFPNKVHKLTNLPIVNHALGGSSIDRIIRTSLIDLYKLKQENPNDKIIAFIGTTSIDRSSVPNNNIGHTDMLGFDIDYYCIAKGYSNTNDEYIEDMRKYKILYETSYHSLINFYQNIMQLKYFSEKNNIDLHFISAFNGIEQFKNIETTFLNRPLLKMYESFLDFNYTLNMKDYIDGSKNEICPGGHFGEPIHDKIANDIVKIIERYK
jgi:hypothetical protein